MTKLYAWTEHRLEKCFDCGVPEECFIVGRNIFDSRPLCEVCFKKHAKNNPQIECVDVFCATCKFRQYKNSNCTTCFTTGVETGDFIHYEPSEAQRLHNSNVKLITSAQELEKENKELKSRFLAYIESHEDSLKLYPIDEWGEEDGDVLWWRLPVEEPPQVTSPISSDWTENYYTHYSKLPFVWTHPEYEQICEQEKKLTEKQFPIHSHDHEWRTGVPWKFARQYEQQMGKNHYQSMEKLAERGGLSAKELYACLTFSEWRCVHNTNEECRGLVDEMLKEQGYE